MENKIISNPSAKTTNSLNRRKAQHQQNDPESHGALVEFVIENVPRHESAASFFPHCFEKLCELIDAFGPKDVWASIQMVIQSNLLLDSSILGNCFRDACMRFNGDAFGKRYTAHLRVLPIIVRGHKPAAFPMELDRITAIRIQSIIQQYLLKQSYGADCLSLPVSFAYTTDEIVREGPPQFYEVTKQALMGCSGYAIGDTPKYVMTGPNYDESTRTDDEMYNVRQPGIGVHGFDDQNMRLAANETPIQNLPEGDWITARFIPIIVLTPHGKTPLTIDGFGAHAIKIGQILSFASRKQTPDSDCETLSVVPLGMYGLQEGAIVAKMKIGHERVVSDIAKFSSLMISEKAFVNLDYNPINQLLSVKISDGHMQAQHEVSLPVGMMAQQFIESLSVGIRSLGLKTEVDTGDSMTRFSNFESSQLH